jgi:hypothetical protein
MRRKSRVFQNSSLSKDGDWFLDVGRAVVLMRTGYRRRVLSRIVLVSRCAPAHPCYRLDGYSATRSERRLRSERLLAIPSMVGECGRDDA